MQRKDIQCVQLPDGSLTPTAPGQMGNSVISVMPNSDQTAAVMLGNSVIAYLSYDFTGQRFVGYTPTSDNPLIMKSLERLFPLF